MMISNTQSNSMLICVGTNPISSLLLLELAIYKIVGSPFWAPIQASIVAKAPFPNTLLCVDMADAKVEHTVATVEFETKS